MEIEIKNLNRLQKLADRYPAVAEKHVNKAIMRSLIRIQDSAKRDAPFGTTGQLRQNWRLDMGRFTGRLSSSASKGGYAYGSAVEYGTRPHFPPIGAISLWARRKGLNPFVIARSISRKGTKANPFFKKAISQNERKVNEEFDKAISDILKEI